MATTFKTPGVYISESGSFPPSIVGVETAVPAFIGYTEIAEQQGKSLVGVPVRVSSMADFTAWYGGRFAPSYALVPTTDGLDGVVVDGTLYSLVRAGPRFILYDCLQLFFANGGGYCYIVSCGTYGGLADPPPVAAAPLLQGLDAIAGEIGPTMVVVPESFLLPDAASHGGLVAAMLEQCLKTQDRMAILDLWGTDRLSGGDDFEATVARFRDALASVPQEALRFAAAYFPFLCTSLVAPEAILPSQFEPPAGSAPITTATPGFPELVEAALRDQGLLPPSPAMAGIYAAVDSSRGVWNAPANVGIASVTAPSLDISDDQQGGLNAPPDGMAVNAIRTFPGQGTLVWGARTLDGNSNDWRYIQVQRTGIYIEQSVKMALTNFVFAPNTASTWATVTTMIGSFLDGVWTQGGLMGATAEQAYSVQVGLGTTMTTDDVVNGIMRVQVLLAMVHPAELIELSFEQKMQGGS